MRPANDAIMSISLLSSLRKFYRSRLFLPASILAIWLCIYARCFVMFRSQVVSSARSDGANYFYYVRQFGFHALRSGHIPQWNPHIYGGVPFFGGWQSALLYPPNLIYLVLPLNLALCLDPAISTYLTGLFGGLLARKLGLRQLSCLLAGTMLMFGGPYFSHVFAGHLTLLAAMAWTPLLMLAVEMAIDEPGVRPVLIGALALGMQILAGHPQTVLYTALMLTVYAAFRLVRASARLQAGATLICMALLGGSLAAVQLLTGLQVSGEGVRARALDYAAATMYSFAPSAVFARLPPVSHRALETAPIWWETDSFVSVAAVVLAMAGVVFGASRRRWLWVGMALLMLLLAMGGNTPVYAAAYGLVPMFNKFRVPGRFLYYAAVFVALLAGTGVDALLAGGPRIIRRPQILRGIGIALAAVSMLELLVYAQTRCAHYFPNTAHLRRMAAWTRTHQGDFRLLENLPLPPNAAMALGMYGVSGYDPAATGRYKTLLDAAGVRTNLPGGAPNATTHWSPVLRLLRCAFIFVDDAGQTRFAQTDNYMPHALVMHHLLVYSSDSDEVRAVVAGAFDPAKAVSLGAAAAGAVGAVGPGEPARATWLSSDTMLVTFTSHSPGMLLITDAYSRFWKATPLRGSCQPRYSVVPADYALIGIPVCAGRHRIMLTYCPPWFYLGSAISVVALGAYLLVLVAYVRRKHG